MPATLNEKEVKTRWPVDEGLIAGTTKHVGNKFLSTDVPSVVRCRFKVGI